MPKPRTPLERYKLELTPPLVWTGALPLAILMFEFFTLAWHWKGQCSAYGFPLPFLEWAGSSLNWNMALPALAIDLSLYLAFAALLLTPFRARLPDYKTGIIKGTFGIFAAIVYTLILAPHLLMFFSGHIDVHFWIDAPGIITVEPWFGAPEYCANEGMKY